MLRRYPWNGHGKSLLETLKWGICPQTPLAWHYPFLASLFHITHDFYDYDLMPSSKNSAHTTEWGPTKVLPIGPRTCQGRPCEQCTRRAFSGNFAADQVMPAYIHHTHRCMEYTQTQNRRQIVFNKGALPLCRGLDIKNLINTPLIYRVSYFNLWGLVHFVGV